MNGLLILKAEGGESVILNTGSRTDIPAFYSEWFLKRLEEGYVLVRSPYNEKRLTRYELTPSVVDAICFCTKNPAPMLGHLDALSPFRTFWMVTITPYETDVEPFVPPKDTVADTVIALSEAIGPSRVVWRYDPIFLSGAYPLSRHLEAFDHLCAKLSGHVKTCVISFIDLYEKTRRNFPEAHVLSQEERDEVGSGFSRIAKKYHIRLSTCLEGQDMAKFGMDCSGCMTSTVLEEALKIRLKVPSGISSARQGCRCLLGSDIGSYNTCGHLCRYCYANADRRMVQENRKRHDPASPVLIGQVEEGDEILPAKQVSWLDDQMALF